MGDIAGHKIHGLTIRESADDGSDFTNPDADYRRLFLGEDGQLHVKDSAGNVTDIGAGSGSVATDSIWDAAGDLAVGSGSNTAARLAIGAAGGSLSVINGAVAWNSGTSFPGSAATGDRYWRTDLAMEFYYDGSRWVCTCLHAVTLVGGSATPVDNASASVSVAARYWPQGQSGMDLWMVSVVFGYRVRTTNTGSAFWTYELLKIASAGSSTSLGSASSAAESPDTWYAEEVAIGAVLDVSAEPAVFWRATKTSTPGNTDANAVLKYRYIAT